MNHKMPIDEENMLTLINLLKQTPLDKIYYFINVLFSIYVIVLQNKERFSLRIVHQAP